MINWGHNPAETTLRFWKYIRQAKAQGAKLVDIGIFSDLTAKGADWWIQVKPGSDGALALAMIHVIIRDALYDEDYIIRHTNGPFLVRTDNGKLLRESDIFPEGPPENYVVWDTAKDRPQEVAPFEIEELSAPPPCTLALTLGDPSAANRTFHVFRFGGSSGENGNVFSGPRHEILAVWGDGLLAAGDGTVEWLDFDASTGVYVPNPNVDLTSWDTPVAVDPTDRVIYTLGHTVLPSRKLEALRLSSLRIVPGSVREAWSAGTRPAKSAARRVVARTKA